MITTRSHRGAWSWNALSARRNSGFYHDGRFASLRAVVEHYNQALALGLTDDQKVRLVEYLKSL